VGCSTGVLAGFLLSTFVGITPDAYRAAFEAYLSFRIFAICGPMSLAGAFGLTLFGFREYLIFHAVPYDKAIVHRLRRSARIATALMISVFIFVIVALANCIVANTPDEGYWKINVAQFGGVAYAYAAYELVSVHWLWLWKAARGKI